MEEKKRFNFSEYLERMRIKTNPPEDITPPLFVPYEIFRQVNDLNTEGMRELYSQLHELISAKQFTAEINLGDIRFVLSGPQEDADKIIAALHETTDKLLKRLLSKTAIENLAKNITVNQGKNNVPKEGYC